MAYNKFLVGPHTGGKLLFSEVQTIFQFNQNHLNEQCHRLSVAYYAFNKSLCNFVDRDTTFCEDVTFFPKCVLLGVNCKNVKYV